MTRSRTTATLLAAAVSVFGLAAATAEDAAAQQFQNNNRVFRIQAPKASQFQSRQINVENRFKFAAPPKVQQAPKVQFAAPPKVQQAPKVQFAAPPKVQQAPKNVFFAAPPKVQQAPKNVEVAEFVAPKAPKAQKIVAPKAPEEIETTTAKIVAPKAEETKVAALTPPETETKVAEKAVEQPVETAEKPAEVVVQKMEEGGIFIVEYKGATYKVRKVDGEFQLVKPVEKKKPVYTYAYEEPAYGYEYADQSYYGGSGHCYNGY
jgi:hypothetical protein